MTCSSLWPILTFSKIFVSLACVPRLCLLCLLSPAPPVRDVRMSTANGLLLTVTVTLMEQLSRCLAQTSGNNSLNKCRKRSRVMRLTTVNNNNNNDNNNKQTRRREKWNGWYAFISRKVSRIWRLQTRYSQWRRLKFFFPNFSIFKKVKKRYW